MVEYISMRDEDAIASTSRKKALEELGIRKDGEIIQPPKCPKCGGGCLEVDLGSKYLQCIECGFSGSAYYYKDTMFKRRGR